MQAETVYNVVKKIPKGKVLTYSRLAELAGTKSARVVGNVLHRNTDPENIPCHRVVNIKGELAKSYAFGGAVIQAKKLALEGVILDNNGRVNLNKYLWK